MGFKGDRNDLHKYDDKYTESEPSLKSSFTLLKHYSGQRGAPFPNIFDWLEVKRRDDNIGNFWRVHDKLYNLEEFINKHPGGSDWIDATRGTDITEAFEASHIVNVSLVEKTLAKYYVKEAKHLRNSPYTFKENGFYKTLKKKVVPVLNKVGTDSTAEILLLQDSLALMYGFFAILAVSYDILALKIVAGIFLSLCVTGGHNFFHKKDNWRQFYFDLSPMSSYEWRLSHAISHHLYPNTILDYEIMLGEPLVEMLPLRERNSIQSYGGMIYAHILYSLHMISDLFKRPISIYKRKQKLRPENVLIYVELIIFVIIAPSVQIAIQSWITIFMAASYTFVVLSNNAAHHHPTSFHDGDETRTDPDFGYFHRSLSLLAKLFNILKDDSNVEINTEYLGIWPTSISNSSAYSIRTVSETLYSLVKQGLKYYPQHFPWLRLNGEIEFANENNEAAMACYTNVLITGSEYCTLHLQRPVIDDHIVKRMIKCLNLGCNMQTAILCQFLEDVDYVLAFKSLSEKSNRAVSFSDAMDAYYDCIWDPTLLEFIIHQHIRKGEHKRKQQAIAIMGQLEFMPTITMKLNERQRRYVEHDF